MLPRRTKRPDQHAEPHTADQVGQLWHRYDEPLMLDVLNRPWFPPASRVIFLARCVFVFVSVAILASTVFVLRSLGGG